MCELILAILATITKLVDAKNIVIVLKVIYKHIQLVWYEGNVSMVMSKQNMLFWTTKKMAVLYSTCIAISRIEIGLDSCSWGEN